MKAFIVLIALVACASADNEKRDKRSFIGGWNSGDSLSYGGAYSGGLAGLGEYSVGLSALSAPAAKVVSVKKVVNTARVVEVPQVVNVRKVVSVPQVVSVNKLVAAPAYSGGLASDYAYGAGYGSLYSSGYGYGAGYSNGWW